MRDRPSLAHRRQWPCHRVGCRRHFSGGRSGAVLANCTAGNGLVAVSAVAGTFLAVDQGLS